MGIFDPVKVIKANQGLVKSHQYELFSMEDLFGLDSLFNSELDVKFRDQLVRRAYENLVTVYRSVLIISNNIAGLPVKLTDQAGKDVTNAPDFNLFRKPNPNQTWYDFVAETMGRLLLQGEFFWYLDRAPNSKKILAMYADWKSEEVRIVTDPEQGIVQYIRTVNGKEVPIPKEDVFFVRLFNPYSSLRGLSPIRVGRHVGELEINAIVFNKRFFNEGMKASGIFTTDKTMDEQQAKRIKKIIKKHYAGLENAWDPLVLWGGLKFQPLNTMSLQDAEFSVLRKMNREDIAMIYGVPIELLNVGKDTYENVKESKKMLWTETLIPMLKKITSLINYFFLPNLTQRKVEFQFDLSGVDALKENLDSVWNRFKEGFDRGAVTPNEIREKVFGLDPIKSSDMNMTYMPANLVPVAELKEGKGKAVGEIDEPDKW